jgi:hypothetical protein
MLPTCKTCKHFNFKVSTVNSWGECLNPTVMDAQWIRYFPAKAIRCSTVHELLRDIRDNGHIYYREDEFGCRFHAPDDDSGEGGASATVDSSDAQGQYKPKVDVRYRGK